MASSFPGWLIKRKEDHHTRDSSSCSSATASHSGASSILSGYDSSSDEEMMSRRVVSQVPLAARKLPAAVRAGEIQEAVRRNRVVCILGDTGCGKSTVVPYLLASEGSVKILCTQPRRMAAISLCEHVQTKFFGQRNHEAVGYRVRGFRNDSEEARIVYVTAGYLKTMLTHEPSKLSSEFTHLILDEVHERGIDSDFLSLIVKRLMVQAENEKLKLVVMSATLESDLFVDYFASLNGGVRPVTVNLSPHGPTNTGEKQHKIEEIFLDDMMLSARRDFKYAESCLRSFVFPVSTSGVQPGDLTEGAQNLAVEIAIASSRNHFSTLIFLPGLGEIFSIYDKLVDELDRRGEVLLTSAETSESPPSGGHYFQIFILHSSMPYEEQRLALQEPAVSARHIVLCTNVAESSLTVPNVDVVIDSGLRRANSFDPVNHVYRLTTVWCSKASCLQRRGRTGRVCSGKYFQLFPRALQMTPYDTPEVLLSDLSSVFLNAKYISEFWRMPESGTQNAVVFRPSEILRELITPPTQRNVSAAVQDLFEAGILRHEADEMSELSLLGTLATRLHVEPQIARVLYFSWLAGYTCEGIVLAAACSLDAEIIRSSGTKYHPGGEEQFCRSIGNHMWYRAGYDLGSFSEPVSVRNLLWSWLAHHYEVSVEGAVPFHKSAVYTKEFDAFKRAVYNHCVQFASWIQEEIGDEAAGLETDMLKQLLSERASSSNDNKELLGKVFKCGRDFDKLKALLVIAMNNRLLTASGWAGEFDENHGLKFEKISEQAFVACDSEKQRFHRMEQIALKLTGRSPESVFQIDRQSELAVNTTWTVFPGRDYAYNEAAVWELKKSNPVEYARVKDDVHVTLNRESEFVGLVMPVSVRTCIQVFDRRFTTQVEVEGKEKIRIKCPKYANGINWARITQQFNDIDPDDFLPTSQWLGISVNPRSPVGWLHKVPPSLRISSSDRFWAVAGKIIGTSRSVFDYEVLPSEARAYNVTILPVAKGGRVGMALLLAALPFQSGLVAQVAISDQGHYEVVRVKIQGTFFELNRSQKHPLTLKMLRSVSALRRAISKALDIPGTSIRRVKRIESDDLKLRITEEAMKKVVELKHSLSPAIDQLLFDTFFETATSQDLFPPGSLATERRVMLITNTGASYGELTLDPTIWTEPEDRRPLGITLFRKDQISDIVKKKNFQQFPQLVSMKDQQEAPIVRLGALGFSVDAIARFLHLRPKFLNARKPIDRIMDPELNEDEILDDSAEWLNPTRHVHDTLTALEIKKILDTQEQEEEEEIVVPKRAPPRLPVKNADNDDEPDWQHVTARLATLRPSQSSAPLIQHPAPIDRKSISGLASFWSEIENEAQMPCAGPSLTSQQKLRNIWNRISLVSTCQDI